VAGKIESPPVLGFCAAVFADATGTNHDATFPAGAFAGGQMVCVGGVAQRGSEQQSSQTSVKSKRERSNIRF
jgi:hypothetical protein